MFKKVFLSVLIVLVFVSSAFAVKISGIGAVFGKPTSLYFRSFVSSSAFVDVSTGWDFNANYVQINADYCLYYPGLLKFGTASFPVHVGAGFALTLSDKPALGIRLPVGLNYNFGGTPINLFAEIVPKIKPVPSLSLDFDWDLGFVFMF